LLFLIQQPLRNLYLIVVTTLRILGLLHAASPPIASVQEHCE
jgi:hypothetical protein